MRAGSVTALLVAAPSVLATVLAARLACDSLAPAWLALVGGAVTAAQYVHVRARSERGARFGGAVALATLVAVLAIPELGLRSAGFRRVPGIEFGYPSPTDLLELEPDPELFWTLPRDEEGTNSLGFAGPQPRVPKPAGTWRALFLGDSCLWQGHPREWPVLAVEELARRSARPLECVNLSLAGYSSLQGARVAQRHGLALEPDLVVVSYGWNDHWLAHGSVDAHKSIDARFERLRRASALVQALAWLFSELDERTLDVPRVSLEEYDANLSRIVRAFGERKIPVVLVTAPSTHDMGVPEYLLKHRFGTSEEDIVRVHERYVERTRELARREGVSLLDLAAEFGASPERAAWFLADGIHFTEAGRAVIARRFAQRSAELGLAP
ncbi:MAG: hypothetical protein FJ298_04360 [Planctomycetes bacterium]|nr:hypothetical protein [Planctomycetota bacterium]